MAAKSSKDQITHLSAERKLIAQGGDVVLQQVHQALEEGVVLALHVRVPEDQAGEWVKWRKCKSASHHGSPVNMHLPPRPSVKLKSIKKSAA